MRNTRIPLVLLLGIGVAWVMSGPVEVAADRGSEKIAMEDDCDPTDLAAAPVGWGPGGCLRDEGTVTRAEFGLLLRSPLAAGIIGHPSWRMDPGYLVVEVREKLKVKNTGGRDHTFTPVVEFGGGSVPPLSVGLTPAPECVVDPNDPADVAPVVIAPGKRAEVKGLTPGNHRFQCCFHPWMRTLVKVTESDGDGHHKD